MIITIDILKAIAPGSKKTNYKHLAGLSLWMNHWFIVFEIDTKQEICHILAQLAHESDSFNAMEEYGSKNKPAGSAYEGRKDLGNVRPGDGVKFKGRGPLQVTGRINYKLMGVKAGAPLKFTDNPELLATPEWGVWSACIFWTEKGLLTISNMPDTAKVPFKKRISENESEIIMLSPIEIITRKVNGGVNGLSERIKFYERAKQIIA